MRKEALLSEKIRKEQDTDTTLTDYYNDALSAHLLHVESLNCRLRKKVKNLQDERRGVERDLVSTEKRCNYYQKRLKTLETENRNLLLTATLGNRNLDYKTSVCHSHHRTSNYHNERINDSSKKRRSSIQEDTTNKKNNNGRFDVSDEMPIENHHKTGNSEESLTEIESFLVKMKKK